MKKHLITFVLALVAVFTLAFCVSAETITVIDDGNANITLGDCVIEDLDREIPAPSAGFTYSLDTETKTAKITKWANYQDPTLGKTFCLPSTVTYEGNTYTVTTFDRVAYGTDNGKGQTNNGNFLLVSVYIPDTVTAIPNSAFDSCKALEYVYIGKNVETMGKLAFNFAGASTGGYYVPTEKETVDSETGEVTVTTEYVVAESIGVNVGNIKEFIFKSKKLTTLETNALWHTEFEKGALIEFDITMIKHFKSYCMGLNQHALTDAHRFEGTNIIFDVFDLTNAETFEDDPFYWCAGGNVMIVKAEHTKYFNVNSIRSNGAAYYNPETGNDGVLIVLGGKTPETAVTLTGPLWTANAFYWYGSTIFMNVIIKGYVNAYDGADGLENQNGYGIDQVDYIFENEDTLRYYFNSVASTTNATTTYARYAKNSRGYFNICDHTAEKGYIAYNCVLNADTSVYELASYEGRYPLVLTYGKVLNGQCTESTLCRVCDKVLAEGEEHNISLIVKYENGFFKAGICIDGCINDGCTNNTKTVTPPIFIEWGYTVAQYGQGSVMQGFVVNEKALDDYNKANKDAQIVDFGVIAGTSLALGETTDVFAENGELATNKVAQKSFMNQGFAIFEMKISGFNQTVDVNGTPLDLTTIGIYNCGYYLIKKGESYESYYMDQGSVTEILPEAFTFASKI